MISFACRDIKFNELIRCSFELNKTEYNIFMFLMTDPEFYSISGISSKINLDRSTVQKAIKKLVTKELVFRTQENLDKGGYVFIYQIKDKDEIKKKMNSIVENWYDKVINEIERW